MYLSTYVRMYILYEYVRNIVEKDFKKSRIEKMNELRFIFMDEREKNLVYEKKIPRYHSSCRRDRLLSRRRDSGVRVTRDPRGI